MMSRLIPRRPRHAPSRGPEGPRAEAEANSAAGTPEGRSAAPSRMLAPQGEPAAGIATETLFARLSHADVEKITSRLSDEHRARYEQAGSLERKRLALAFGLFYGVENVDRRTELTAVLPPEGVHLMDRQLVEQTGGAYRYADLVLDFLTASGQPLARGDKVLDFSSSSGRVVRVLAAARPDVSWHGCDPNQGAIAWAAQNLPQVDFFVSDTAPPLPFEDGTLAAAYAISVWSHYNAAAALRWFDEMHRVIRPGGHLIFTTHGMNSTAWFSSFRDSSIDAVLGESWVLETVDRLQSDGHCFWDVFGERGDDGVLAGDWGLAFFTPEWLMERVTPAWGVTYYRIGRADGNQDAFALRRR